MQKIADREKIMESAEVLFAVFKGDRVHDKMQMTVRRVHVQGIYDLMPRKEMADMVVSKTRSDKETAKSLLSAYVVAVEMIRHYVRFGNSAQQKRRTENV